MGDAEGLDVKFSNATAEVEGYRDGRRKDRAADFQPVQKLQVK